MEPLSVISLFFNLATYNTKNELKQYDQSNYYYSVWWVWWAIQRFKCFGNAWKCIETSHMGTEDIFIINTSYISKRLFTFLLHRYIADPSDHFSGQLTTPFGIE